MKVKKNSKASKPNAMPKPITKTGKNLSKMNKLTATRIKPRFPR